MRHGKSPGWKKGPTLNCNAAKLRPNSGAVAGQNVGVFFTRYKIVPRASRKYATLCSQLRFSMLFPQRFVKITNTTKLANNPRVFIRAS
jgi:hypothetical protein